MQIVIEIPRSEIPKRQDIIEIPLHFIDGHIVDADGYGFMELPKGYGRLIILSEDKLKENQINLDFSCQKWINEVGLSNATVEIIEAESAESEE